MTMMNGEPDYEEDGVDQYCAFCGEELNPDGSCSFCDDDDDDDDEFEDDLESEDSIEALIDMEDHLDE